MRGVDEMQESLFTISKLADFVPVDHPLRPVRTLVNDALARLNGLFNPIHADDERLAPPYARPASTNSSQRNEHLIHKFF